MVTPAAPPPLELGKLVLGVSAPPPPHGFPRASPRARCVLARLAASCLFLLWDFVGGEAMGNVEHDRQRGHTIAGAVAPAGAPVVAAAVPVQEQQSVEELRAARLRSIMQRREQQAQPMLKPSQAKPLLATDPRHAGHRVPSDRAPALRPGTALRMQRCAWQKRPTPAVLPVAQAWRGRVGVRLRTRSLPRQISRAMQRNLRTCYS